MFQNFWKICNSKVLTSLMRGCQMSSEDIFVMAISSFVGQFQFWLNAVAAVKLLACRTSSGTLNFHLLAPKIENVGTRKENVVPWTIGSLFGI